VRAEGVLTEFVEAAEPKRARKMKRCWWWQPSQFTYRRIEYWPTSRAQESASLDPAVSLDPTQVVVLPMYGGRINSRGGDAE
jgi:hypothetical protein